MTRVARRSELLLPGVLKAYLDVQVLNMRIDHNRSCFSVLIPDFALPIVMISFFLPLFPVSFPSSAPAWTN